MHSIFNCPEYQPQQILIYIFNFSAISFATLFMLNSKFSKVKTFLISLVVLYISLFPKHFDNAPEYTHQIILLFIPISVILLYKEKLHIKVISSTFSLLTMLGADYFSYFIVAVLLGHRTNYLKQNGVYLISAIILIILLCIYVLLWNRFYKNNVNVFLKNNIVFLFIFIITELIFTALFITEYIEIWKYVPNDLKNANRTFLIMYIFIFIIADLLIIYFIKSSSKYHKIKRENEMLEYQNKLQTEYYRKIQENLDKTAKLRHDINNLIQIINIQISKNTTESREDAKKIAGEITCIMDNTKTRKFCDNRIINTVLFDKMTFAGKNAIKIIDNIFLGENSGITDFDLCRVFINLLDNAINALIDYDKGKNKNIVISCKENNGYIYIKCENPSLESIKKSKNKSSSRGYGLKIIKDIAEKYDGTLIIKNENSIFSALVTLKSV